MNDPILIPHKVFRETESVVFCDISVEGSNAQDLVIHTGPAVSPPDDPDESLPQFYIHRQQVDNNRVLSGSRTFYLYNLDWDEPLRVVTLTRESGALRIPKGTYHRSISGSEGSIVINQAIRDTDFDTKSEFIPRPAKDIPGLLNAMQKHHQMPSTTLTNNYPKIDSDMEIFEKEASMKIVELTSKPHEDSSGFHQLEGKERDTLQYRLYDF